MHAIDFSPLHDALCTETIVHVFIAKIKINTISTT